MASHPRLPPKKDVALALLEQSTVFVHLDPRNDAVRVPPWFKKQPQLVLQIGLNMAIPIPDLDVGEDGISCTLSFSRSPHFCWIPWTSVFALVGDNGRGMVWPDDVPREVAAQAAQQQRTEQKPSLRAVPSKPQPAAPARTTEAKDVKDAKEEKPKKKRSRKPAAVAKEAAAPTKKATRAEPRANAPRPAAKPAPVAAAPAPAARGASATTSSAAGDKRRRALPPYLRVIK
ncbi:MAG TPA: ClpXP protease specificity-enhancing factor SspB [Polyangiaceae bacterium]